MPLTLGKKLSQPKNKAHSVVGIEFDIHAIRAVRVNHNGSQGYQVMEATEERGDFNDEGELLEGLRKVRTKLSVGTKDRIATAITGKQVWAGEIQFQKLPENELISALKLEVRKNLHFESSGASLDYQILSEPKEEEKLSTYLVIAAHNNLIQRQVAILERANYRPTIVETLPVVVANALWAQVGDSKPDLGYLAIHFSPQVCTIVIDGNTTPFFNRSIYFTADEVFGKEVGLSDRERDRRLTILGEEISRTLAYYEKNSSVSGFGLCTLYGDYSSEPGLAELVHKSTGIRPSPCDLLAKFGYGVPVDASKFALSLALALRDDG